MDDTLTRPERFAQLDEARRYRRVIFEKGGCAFCVHRDKAVLAWGRAVCASNNARSFPLCMKDGRAPAFQLDQTTLQRNP
ncbi:MAG TPA: hypothetical protein VIN35_11845 [Hydrogenophaga sp.]